MTMKVLLLLIINTITVAATVTGVQVATPPLKGGQEVAWGPTGGSGTFVAVGQINSNNLLYSVDAAVTWQAATTTVTQQIASVCWGKDKFVLVLNTCATKLQCVMTSPDGKIWTLRSFGAGLMRTGKWWDVRYGNNKFVAVMHEFRSNEPNQIQISADGMAWTSVTSPNTNDLLIKGAAYGAGKWVAIGNVNGIASQPKDAAKAIMTSTDDGASWAYTASPANGRYAGADIHFANNLFVWANGQKIYTSIDGLAWTMRFSGAADDAWMSLGYGGNTWIVTNNAYGASTGTDRVMTSTDGVTWTRGITPSGHETTSPWSAKSIAYGDNKFVVAETNFGAGGCTSKCITVFTPTPTPTPTPAKPAAAKPTAAGATSDDDNTAAIAGGVVGGIIGLILLIAACYYFIVVAKKDEESKWSVQSADGTWHTYDADTCKVLEAQQGNGSKETDPLQPTKPQQCGTVTVDFDKMVELSRADDGTVLTRKVRRSEGDDEASPATTGKDLEVGLEMDAAAPSKKASLAEAPADHEEAAAGDEAPAEEAAADEEAPAEEATSA